MNKIWILGVFIIVISPSLKAQNESDFEDLKMEMQKQFDEMMRYFNDTSNGFNGFFKDTTIIKGWDNMSERWHSFREEDLSQLHRKLRDFMNDNFGQDFPGTPDGYYPEEPVIPAPDKLKEKEQKQQNQQRKAEPGSRRETYSL